MTNQSTIDKLIEMRLTAMADAFRIQMDDPIMKEGRSRTASVCLLISSTAIAKITG